MTMYNLGKNNNMLVKSKGKMNLYGILSIHTDSIDIEGTNLIDLEKKSMDYLDKKQIEYQNKANELGEIKERIKEFGLEKTSKHYQALQSKNNDGENK